MHGRTMTARKAWIRLAALVAGLGAFSVEAGNPAPIQLVREAQHGLEGFYFGGFGSADFDRDGLNDLVVSGSFDAAHTPDMANLTCVTQTRLYRNTSTVSGPISFELAASFPWRGCRGSAVAIADFNRDGRPDFAVEYQGPGDPEAVTAVFLHETSFTFRRVPLPGGIHKGYNNAIGMAAVDMDQDGATDLVFNANGNGALPALWYRNPGSGEQFTPRQIGFHNTLTAGTLAAGDLTGDGFPEIAIGGNAPAAEPFGNVTCDSLNYGHVFANGGATNPQALPDPLFEVRLDPTLMSPPGRCLGMDNAGMLIADVDADGANDLITAGSAPGFFNAYSQDFGVHYSLSVLFNSGDGTSFTPWLNAIIPNPWGYGDANSGAGNEDLPNIATGDLNGDGQLEIFIQGHRRNREGRQQPDDPACTPDPDGNGPDPCVGYYVFDSMLLVNEGNRSLSAYAGDLPDVGAGGQIMADFNGDGLDDLIFSGARLPWHSNGANGIDMNTAATLVVAVYRNLTDPTGSAGEIFVDGFE